MKTDVAALYHLLWKGEGGKLELKRKRYVATIMTYRAGLVGLGVAILILSFFSAVLATCAVAGGIVLFILMDRRTIHFSAQIEDEYKTIVLPEVVRLIDERLTYDRFLGLRPYYDASGIYPQMINSCISGNTITGTIGKTAFAFGELYTTRKNGDTVRTVFDGTIFVADFNKKLTHTTILVPDRAEALFGSTGRKLQELNPHRTGELIRLENPEFEKAFAIYSTNEQEARYILTPDMMEKLVLLNRRLGENIRISFTDRNIIVACPGRTNHFEFSIFDAIPNRSDIGRLIVHVRTMSEIINVLDLNTRIWTKD